MGKEATIRHQAAGERRKDKGNGLKAREQSVDHTNVAVPFTRLCAAIGQQLDPAAVLRRTWPLHGGLSATSTALELEYPNGLRERVVLRQISDKLYRRDPQAAATEFGLLHALHRLGLAVPEPYLLDESCLLAATPLLVMAYIDGQPQYTLAQPIAGARHIASQLAAIHRVSTITLELSGLPNHATRVAALLAQRPAVLDVALHEAALREVLERMWPLPQRSSVLLHGDFWPGNLLWRDDQIVAVIDWEDAALGDPLADLAISRLDMLWLFGRAAMQAFTQHYQRLTACDLTDLPYWDVYAALRPAGRLGEWAAGWPALGRPDLTETTMRAAHGWFVEQAFEQINKSNKVT